MSSDLCGFYCPWSCPLYGVFALMLEDQKSEAERMLVREKGKFEASWGTLLHCISSMHLLPPSINWKLSQDYRGQMGPYGPKGPQCPLCSSECGFSYVFPQFPLLGRTLTSCFVFVGSFFDSGYYSEVSY